VGVAGTGRVGTASGSISGAGTTVPLLNKALYYLSDVDPAQVAAHATSFDVKCFDPTADGGVGNTFWSSAQVAAARGGHGICLAYFDCGGLEPGRYYYDATTRAISSYPAADEWGEYAIEFWTTTWLNITTAWVDKAMAAGFDGIYLDVVDGFGGTWVVSRAPAIGGSAAGTGAAAGKQMIAYIQNVRNYCQTKKPGFVVWVNSGVYGSDGFDVPLTDTATYGTSPRYVDVIDGMFIEEVLYSYSGGSVKANSSANRTDMHTALSPVVTAGKPVSLVEYCGSGGVTVVGGVPNAIHDVRNTATSWNMGYYISEANYPNPDLGIVDMEGITTP
jgi:cysteinyl-tRNA synthetase